ncbi:synaptonemal complex protein 2-like isoform X4 [Hemicordylus capensis]|uniref:synaptonemal complex protein 2-like isoform X4 n=1 Tax=Hemicordylus capensis TaxID=884348 RepID=UPI00230295BD|nr:synaptonemal complex protein 2-like isoform X4 [Hemicordylus capensis]
MVLITAEEESQEEEIKMPDRTEYYDEESEEEEIEMPDGSEHYVNLESLLSETFEGKGFEKIDEMLQERDIYPPQKYSKLLLNQLDRVLKKELDKNEFPNVSLLLKCIQMYCKSDPQESVSLLLQQGLISKMVTWFERAREFLSVIEPKENRSLVRLVEDFLDTALAIGKSNAEGKKQLLESFLPYMGHLATESHVNCALRQEALRTLNTLLNDVTREEKIKLAVSEEMRLLTKDLAKSILDVGDYDIQVAIVEALFRIMRKKWRDDLVHIWFEDQHLAKAFKEIKDGDFETDCRNFLNELNEKLGDKSRVCSIPCKAAQADMNELKKPADDKLEEFWINFNFGSESVTFFLESSESALWDSVRLPKEDISSFYVEEEQGEKILKMLMKNSASINKKEATNIRIHFDSHFDISTPVRKALGEEKMMIMLDTDDNCSRDQPQQSGREISSHVEGREDAASADSLSQLSDQSVVIIKMIPPAVATAARDSQQTEKEQTSLGQASTDVAAVTIEYPTNSLDVPQPLNIATMSKASPLKEEDITIVPSAEEESDLQAVETLLLEDDDVEKEIGAGNTNKQVTEAKEDAYEFENSSDSVAHEMVSEMKQKVFAQKSSLHRSSEKRNVELNKSERRLGMPPNLPCQEENKTVFVWPTFFLKSSNYKNHLFSESNRETASTGTSERSWILDSQKKSLPKPNDYSRKRLKVKSNLKVLPLSSPSSVSDHRAKKAGSSATYREKTKRRMLLSTEIPNTPTVQQSGIASSSLSHVGLNGLEIADTTLPLSDDSSSGYSDANISKKYEAASSTLPLEDKVSTPKRKFSDLSASLVSLTKKQSKLTERNLSNEQSPSILFEPRKLFNSTELEEETQKDHDEEELEADLFVSKILTEDPDDSGFMAVFENFIDELKQSFWSRYKKLEICTHNIMLAPEHNMSALLNWIHQCRLNELENFRQIVVQQLDSLEKRTHFLLSLEKDTVEFWAKQSTKLNSKLNAFCSQQKQRILSMDSVPDETWNLKDTVKNENC